MSSIGHLSELDVLRSQVADLSRQLVERDCSIQDLREQFRRLRNIVEDTAAETGDEFLAFLVTHLSAALKVQYAIIGEVQGDRIKKIRTLAVSVDGALVDNFEYELAHTPCATALTQTFARFDRDLQAMFPQFQRLADLGAESYCAVPIKVKGGAVIGLLVVMDTKPLEHSDDLQTLLGFFVPRLTAEFERKRAEEERVEALTNLHNVIESIPDIVFALDTQGNLVKWNRRLVDVTGYSSEELLNKSALAFVPPEEQTRTAVAIQRAFTEGYAELEGHLLTKDFRTIPYHWTGALLKNFHGEPIGITGIGRDVSDKRKAMEALRESEQRFALAVEGSSDILWDARRLPGEPWHAPRTPIWWSPRVRELLGLEESESFETLEQWAARLHPNDKDRVFGQLTAHIEHRDPYDVEYQLRTNRGDYRWVRGRGQASWDEQGTLVRMSGSCQDITDQKQIEQALRDSEAKFRMLAEETTDRMWEVNEQAVYTYCSPKIRDLLGYEPDEALGKTPFDFMLPEEARRVAGLFGPIVEARKSFSGIENTNRHKDGRYVTFKSRGLPVIDAGGVFRGYRGFDQDITERRKGEEALRISEERFRAIFENSAVGIAVGSYTAGTGIDQVNPAFQSMTGYSSEELCRLGIEGLTHPDDLSASKAFMKQLIVGDLNHDSTEQRFVKKDGSIMWTQTTVSSILDTQGDYKNSVTMIQDITNRKQAEEALIHNEHQLRTVLDALPVGVWFTDRLGKPLLANSAAQQIWSGVKRVGVETDANGAGWWEEIGLSSALHRWALSKALTTGVATLHETLDLECPDGTKKVIRNSTIPIQDQAGSVLGAIVLNEDITTLRLAQEALKLTQFSVDHAVEGFFWFDSEAKILSVNERACRVLEYTHSELTAMALHDIDPNLDLEHWSAQWEKLKQNGAVTFESKYWSSTGRVLDAEVTVNYLDYDGKEFGCAIMRDITERKRVEEIVRESEQAIRALHEATVTPGLSFDDRIRAVLGVGCQRFKLPIGVLTRVVGEELEFTHVYAPGTSFTAGMAVPLSTTYCQTTLQSTGPVCVEHAGKSDWRNHPGYKTLGLECYIGTQLSFGLVHVNGTICFLGEDPYPVPFSQADKDFLQLIARWIVGELDRVVAEQALVRSEERYHELYDDTPTMYFTLAMDGTVRSVNRYGAEQLGYLAEELIGHSVLGVFHEEDKEAVAAGLSTCFAAPEITKHWEFRKVRKDGRIIWVRETTRVGRSFSGETVLLVTCEDITGQRQAEAELRDNHTLLSAIMDTSTDFIYIKDVAGRYLLVNPALAQFMGLSIMEVLGQDDYALLPPELAESCVEVDKQVLATGVPMTQEECGIKGGNIYAYLTTKAPYRDPQGRIIGVIGVSRDISERKRSEDDLRKSHSFIRQIIDADPNFIFVKNRAGQFTLVNKAVADAYGTTVEHLIGKTDAEFNANPEEVEFFRQKDLEVMDSLKERFIPEEVITDSTGRQRWLQTMKRPILDEEGRAIMVLGASTDITDRKCVEEILRQRERDLRTAVEERERISQDLHDGILQSLFAVGLGLEAAKSMMSPGVRKASGRPLNQAIQQLNLTMREIRSFIAGLGSDVLKGKDLPTELKHMLKSLTESQATRVHLAVDDRAVQALSNEQSLHLLRVIQEAVSNCIRHGRAQEARVSLKMLKQGIRLSILDNGCGFKPDTTKGTGYGLINMASRAQKLGGRFTILSKMNQGTRITLDLPKEAPSVTP